MELPTTDVYLGTVTRRGVLDFAWDAAAFWFLDMLSVSLSEQNPADQCLRR
jgi:hypothetical protein